MVECQRGGQSAAGCLRVMIFGVKWILRALQGWIVSTFIHAREAACCNFRVARVVSQKAVSRISQGATRSVQSVAWEGLQSI
jgi:hypothetical protein